ncbi:DUF2125 domain-containing protein [Roseivivax sediminis]|uniref:DUF2125 domain-containing protein n=1 Tax=Roseivivax sediminis TaxID=936889 RepID=A0A1I1U7B9_9RHOB|nr:DUF2125 domain-containing protein [Roseivivax sediminis]SFD66756.1 hypothetical protein SAMN04515678_102195 [Roseivivax sediminis]
MRRRSALLRATAGLALTAAAGPAAADVTPAEVWANLSDYMQNAGYEVEATQEETADGLRVSDIVMTLPVVADEAEGAEGEVSIRIDQIVLTGEDDGTVTVTLPDAIPIELTGDGDDMPERMLIETSSPDFEMSVSGTPEDLVYDYAAGSYELRLAELVIDGEPVGRDDTSGQMRLEAMSGRMRVASEDGGQRVEQETSADTLTYDVAAVSPESEPGAEETFTMAGRAADVTLDGSWWAPEGWDPNDMAAMLEAGFSVDAAMSYRDGSTQFSFSGPEGEGSGQSVADRGVFSMALSESGMAIELDAEGVAYAATGPDLPFPVTAEMSRAGFRMEMPLAESEEPRPFGLGLRLTDVAVSDTLWSLMDPSGALPRDPANLVLDLSGTATAFANLLDPEAMARLERSGGMPGEINSLEIEELRLSAVGAELTGEGAFTFDNSDMESFDGVPAPEGEATLRLSGADGLIDTLVELGFIGQEEAMGARMMMSMFTVPGDAEDTLTSTIEINDEGQIRANGQRIR